MTNQLMIKSHTGVMVQARVGMVVRYYWGAPEPAIDTITGVLEDRIISVSSSGGCITTQPPEHCTMIFCPFQESDDVEIRSRNPIVVEVTGGVWKSIKLSTKEEVDYANNQKGEFEVRHADPNLRPAPDYQPTRSDV